MPTYFATFESIDEGRHSVEDLLRDGVPPENISLISATGDAEEGFTLESNGVGDASYFVGRDDDPKRSAEADVRRIVAKVPRSEDLTIGGPDTSAIDLDVESIDQSDDSQTLAEDSTYPFRGVSYGSREFEKDELELNHGFPTRPDSRDDVFDEETPLEDQGVSGLETVRFGGRGVVIGSGALATVALDFFDPVQPNPLAEIYRYLVDDGVPRPDAEAYRDVLKAGKALIAVEIVPGRTHEESVEGIVERHHGQRANLFAGRRFHDYGT